MQSELDMSNVQWGKWSRDIMELVAGTPDPNREVKIMLPQVLIMVGVPGSGKSTIANQLVEMGWERVNQDELGTRRVCETRMENALQRGKSIVIDRCNFDISQRHTWIQLAAKYKVSTVRALSLDIDPEICKKRIFVRKDHPTIASGSSEGAKIIDRFKKTLVWPKEVEGFVDITTVRTEEEEKHIAKKFSLEGIEMDPNFKLKGKNKD